MNIKINGTRKPAVITALVGLCLMVFFLATGSVSPEPHHHPAWKLWLVETLPGQVFFATVTLLCLPAFMVAAFVARWTGLEAAWSYDLVFWVTACLVQIVLFYGGAMGVATLVRWLRS